jgi:hypothetical protein
LLRDGLRVIEDGVNENDWVVVNGLQRARPGTKVQTLRSTMSGVPERQDGAAEPVNQTAGTTELEAASNLQPPPPEEVPQKRSDAGPSVDRSRKDTASSSTTPSSPSSKEP